MSELLVALGLFFVIEGVLYAALPSTVRVVVEYVAGMDDQTLRTTGVVSVLIGTVIVWFVKG